MTKRWTTIPVLALALAAFPAAAGAASFLDRAFGTPEIGASARMRGMGGAGSALESGPAALVSNPAALALGGGRRLSLGGALARASENRFVPLFDTFDSYVDETAIAVNDHGYGEIEGGVALDPPETRGVQIAAGRFERYDPRYDYYDERRTTATTDVIVSERFIRTRGTLAAITLGAARALPWGTSAGFAVNRYGGTIETRDALVPRAAGVNGRIVEERRDLSGTSVTLGATWRANERLSGALAWESGAKLHDDYAVWNDGEPASAAFSSRDVHLPPRVTAGAAYRPRNALRSTFAMDATWTGWSNVSDAADPARELLDTWDLRFGLEHVYYQGLPGRIGLRYERSWETREADRVWFTFGAGWRLERLALDGSVEIAKRDSRQEPLWPRAEQGGAVGTGRDRVEDTLVRLTFGAEVSF